MFSLQGKTALVTGASGGIGKAIVKALLAQGATVAVSGTSPDKLALLASEVGGNVKTIACNLSNVEDVKKLAENAEKELGKVDILVNNAGITKDGLLMRMKEEDFTDVLNVNLTASFVLAKALVRGMMKNRFGRIINITSVVGTMGNPGQANYCASKGGVTAMTKL